MPRKTKAISDAEPGAVKFLRGGGLAVDTPDPEDPKDFSDFDVADQALAAKAKDESMSFWEMLGYTPQEFRRKMFLIKHPTMRVRINIMAALTTWQAIAEKDGASEDYLIAVAQIGQKVLYVPDSTGGEPVEATVDEILDHFDTPDIFTLIDAIGPRSAQQEWADSGGDPKASAESTLTTGEKSGLS